MRFSRKVLGIGKNVHIEQRRDIRKMRTHLQNYDNNDNKNKDNNYYCNNKNHMKIIYNHREPVQNHIKIIPKPYKTK